MDVSCVCPNCSQSFVLDNQMQGAQATCPHCGQVVAIPANQELPPPVLTPDPVDTANPYASSSTVEPASAGLGDDAAVRMLIPVGRSTWAIAAGYFGLFSLACFPAPIAIILGLIALRDIKRSGGKKHGAGRAWFGLIMGLIFTIVPLGFMAFAAISDSMR